MNIKKSTFTFSLVATLLTITSCSSQNSTIAINENTYVNPYDFIGEFHNSIMDSIKVNNIRKSQLIDFTNRTVAEKFHDTSTYANNEDVEPILNGIEKRTEEYATSSRASVLIDDSIRAYIPSDYLPYIEKLNNTIDLRLSDSLTIKQHFYSIEESINNNAELNEEDKANLLAITAIAKYSTIYNRAPESRSATYGSVAKADLGGAITGVISWKCWGKAAVSGLLFGPGGTVLTVAKEAVRGAIVGSAFNIITGGAF